MKIYIAEDEYTLAVFTDPDKAKMFENLYPGVVIREMESDTLSGTPSGKNFYVEYDFEDDRINGYDRVNRYGDPYTITGYMECCILVTADDDTYLDIALHGKDSSLFLASVRERFEANLKAIGKTKEQLEDECMEARRNEQTRNAWPPPLTDRVTIEVDRRLKQMQAEGKRLPDIVGLMAMFDTVRSEMGIQEATQEIHQGGKVL